MNNTTFLTLTGMLRSIFDHRQLQMSYREQLQFFKAITAIHVTKGNIYKNGKEFKMLVKESEKNRGCLFVGFLA